MTFMTRSAETAHTEDVGLAALRARLDILMRFSAAFAALAALLGGMVLIFGWVLGFESIKRLHPALPGMAVSTAAGLLGCASCVLHDYLSPRSPRRRSHVITAAALLGLAAVNLVLVTIEPGRGIDQVLLGISNESGDAYMAPATAISLALAASCLLVRRRHADYLDGEVFGLLTAAGFVVTSLALTSYAFDSDALREVFPFAAMSVPTAFGYFLLFVSLALSRPTWGWIRIVVGTGPGSATLRRTLPYVIAGPFAFCWVTLTAVGHGVFNANFRLSVLAIASVGGLAVLLFWSASRENADGKTLLKSNQRLRGALKDRDILLQEVYHRVKNNLQFVDAMLAMETYENGPGNGTLEEHLNAIRARVHALALVHQQLVKSKSLSTLDLRDFLDELCRNQAKGAGFDARGIRVDTRVVSAPIDLDRAIPVGLIVAELLSNASKHAFPDGRQGVILVAAERTGNEEILMVVRDNGVGRRDPTEGSNQVGSMIVHSLAAQLNADLDIDDRDGVQVKLVFPLLWHEGVE